MMAANINSIENWQLYNAIQQKRAQCNKVYNTLYKCMTLDHVTQ